jgi:aryl-alcohol dehydrogenase-like predicted oxidoreductase
MDYRILGRTGVSVSRLCLGAMMFGGPTPEKESNDIVARALEAGINFFDVADAYNQGEAERVLGRALKGRRDRVVLASKFGVATGEGPNDGGASRYHLANALHASLRRLDTDRIDVYYIHKHDYATPLEETLRALDDCVRAGKVRYVACSNFYAWQVVDGLAISRAQGLPRFACVQPQYNIVNRDAELELLPACAQHGVGVVSYAPIARGVLSGKYTPGAALPEGSRAARGDRRIQQAELRDESMVVAQALRPLAERHGRTLAQFAIAWVLANRAITSAIIGPRTLAQLEDNLGALGWTLAPEDERAVDALVPRGEHTGKGYNDPQYPVRGRMLGA